MRAVALHRDVLVFVSRVWQTTCTAVRGGGESFLIDSPVYPDELEALPQVLQEAGFSVAGRLATHGDWDHLLCGFPFPRAPLGCAESTAARLSDEPREAEQQLREFDEEHYVERPGALALGSLQPLPVPGHVSLGDDRELELHRAEGHTRDGMAIFIRWARVLVCGDYASPVEIPMISPGGSIDAYAQTLVRLRPLVDAADTVVPGHGTPMSREAAMRVLDEDAAYLDALRQDGAGAELPRSRRTSAQLPIHEANTRRALGSG